MRNLGLEIFIDTEHPEIFVFNHVPDTLKKIYDNTNIVMLIFLSEDYIKKDFTKYEGYIAFDRFISEKRLAIIKLDENINLPWLPSAFFYYSTEKYSMEQICKSLYLAIKNESIGNCNDLFNEIVTNLPLNVCKLSKCYDSNTCVVFKGISKESFFIKISLNIERNNIAIFFESSQTELYSFPIAEFFIEKNHIQFYNKGISDEHRLSNIIFNIEEAQQFIIELISAFLGD